MMERVANKAKNHKEAEQWDVYQQIRMTPKQRQEIVKELKKRFFGENPRDVRSVKK